MTAVLDLLLALAAVVLPLLLAWWLLGRELRQRSRRRKTPDAPR